VKANITYKAFETMAKKGFICAALPGEYKVLFSFVISGISFNRGIYFAITANDPKNQQVTIEKI